MTDDPKMTNGISDPQQAVEMFWPYFWGALKSIVLIYFTV